MTLAKLFLVFIVTLSLTNFGKAQTDDLPKDLNLKVSAQTTVTYLDLIRKVFPDAKISPKSLETLTASTKIPLRHLFEENGHNEFLPEMRGEMVIGISEKLQTTNQSEKILWLLISVITPRDKSLITNEYSPTTDNYSVLAAFRVKENEAQLIDAAEINDNEHTSFSESFGLQNNQSKIAIAPRHEAIFIRNYTQLSLGSESFALLDVDKNGFRIIFKEFVLEHDNRCDGSFNDLARIKRLKNSTNGFHQLEVRVTMEKGGGDIVYWRRHYRYVFGWNPRTRRYRLISQPKKKRPSILHPARGCGES